MVSKYSDIAERMADAARQMEDQHDPSATVKSAVELLVRNVPGCTSASISLVYGKKRVETPAASDELAAVGDRLQAELAEGPALDTLDQHESVYIPDLATEDRWPTWGPRLTEATGARSVLTFRLFTFSDVIGALRMYSVEEDAFAAEDHGEGLARGARVAIGVLAAQRAEQFETALDTRTVIGQACGMVMERYGLDAAAAFGLLTRISSTENVKLRDVATAVVARRTLPPTQGPT